VDVSQECPSETELAGFLAGQLSPELLLAVQVHLDSCLPCIQLLRSLSSSQNAAASDALAAGERIDEYRLVRSLGQGAMGHVYVAFDEILHRTVALKLLREGGAEARARFEVEARAVARLSHPNVVLVFRVGRAHGRPYLVSELIHGRSLDQLDLPVDPAKALRIATDLARGLAAAHRGGVLHRDIKPANAMLADDGTAKLLDFGLAKLVTLGDETAADRVGGQDHSNAPVRLTQTGALLGTPRYMAPEVLLGGAATMTADVYSLGAVLFELCSGRPPYLEDSLPALRAAITREPPRLDELLPSVSADLAAVVNRCLAAASAERYPTGEAMLMALEKLAPPPSVPGAVTRVTRRPARLDARVVVAAVMALATGIAVLIARYLPSPSKTPLAGSRGDAVPSIQPLVERSRASFSRHMQIALSRTGDTIAMYVDGVLSVGTPSQASQLALPLTVGRPASLQTLTFFPAGDRLLISGGSGAAAGSWIVPLNGAPATPLGKDTLANGVVSPDGTHVVFRGLEGFYVRALAGGAPVRVFMPAPDETVHALAWSPAGEEIALLSGSVNCTTDGTIDIVSSSGTSTRRVYRGPRLVSANCSAALAWPSDSTLAYAQEPLANERSTAIVELAAFGERPIPARVYGWPDAEISALRRSSNGWVVEKLTQRANLLRQALDDQGTADGSPEATPLPSAMGPRGVFSNGEVLLADVDPSGLVDLLIQPPGRSLLPRALAYATPRLNGGRVAITARDEVVFWRPSRAPEACVLVAVAEGVAEHLLPRSPSAEPIVCASQIRCARRAQGSCALMEVTTGRARFSRFDPRTGERSPAFFQVPGEHAHWAISNDGHMIAVVTDPGQPVRIVATSSGATRPLDTIPDVAVEEPVFAADDRSVLVTVDNLPGVSPYAIVRFDLRGGSRVVWQDKHSLTWPASVAPSMDGRTLIFYSRTRTVEVAELAEVRLPARATTGASNTHSTPPR